MMGYIMDNSVTPLAVDLPKPPGNVVFPGTRLPNALHFPGD
jgi:hypothetical protein